MTMTAKMTTAGGRMIASVPGGSRRLVAALNFGGWRISTASTPLPRNSHTISDSVQAVITRRAFAALNEIPTANFAATQNPQIEVGFAEYTGRNFGFALRLESVAFRNQVEEAIECMKLDGWLVKNYEKWFKQPAPNDPALRTVFPGWGPPGFKGHDPTLHTPKCN